MIANIHRDDLPILNQQLRVMRYDRLMATECRPSSLPRAGLGFSAPAKQKYRVEGRRAPAPATLRCAAPRSI